MNSTNSKKISFEALDEKSEIDFEAVIEI